MPFKVLSCELSQAKQNNLFLKTMPIQKYKQIAKNTSQCHNLVSKAFLNIAALLLLNTVYALCRMKTKNIVKYKKLNFISPRFWFTVA